MSRARILAAALALSASAFVSILSDEGYTDKEVIPTQSRGAAVAAGQAPDCDGVMREAWAGWKCGR